MGFDKSQTTAASRKFYAGFLDELALAYDSSKIKGMLDVSALTMIDISQTASSEP